MMMLSEMVSTTEQGSPLHDLSEAVAGEVLAKHWLPYLTRRVQVTLEALKPAGPKDVGELERLQDDFFACLFTLRSKMCLLDSDHLLERGKEQWPEKEPLFRHVLELWDLGSFEKDTSRLFGVKLQQLDQKYVNDNGLLLVMRVGGLEWINAVAGRRRDGKERFPAEWGLTECLGSLLTSSGGGDRGAWKPKPAPEEPETEPTEEFHDSMYVMTHVIFALAGLSPDNAPGFRRRLGKQLGNRYPFMLEYFRTALRYWMGRVAMRKQQQQQEGKEGGCLQQPGLYVDLDGSADLCDILENYFGAEAALCERCREWLLASQRTGEEQDARPLTDSSEAREDSDADAILPSTTGSWPLSVLSEHRHTRDDFYDLTHPTWTAVMALLPKEGSDQLHELEKGVWERRLEEVFEGLSRSGGGKKGCRERSSMQICTH